MTDHNLTADATIQRLREERDQLRTRAEELEPIYDAARTWVASIGIGDERAALKELCMRTEVVIMDEGMREYHEKTAGSGSAGCSEHRDVTCRTRERMKPRLPEPSNHTIQRLTEERDQARAELNELAVMLEPWREKAQIRRPGTRYLGSELQALIDELHIVNTLRRS